MTDRNNNSQVPLFLFQTIFSGFSLLFHCILVTHCTVSVYYSLIMFLSMFSEKTVTFSFWGTNFDDVWLTLQNLMGAYIYLKIKHDLNDAWSKTSTNLYILILWIYVLNEPQCMNMFIMSIDPDMGLGACFFRLHL